MAEAQAATPAKEKPKANPNLAATGRDGNAVVLKSGQKRIDYIREQFKAGKKRGEIAKELGVPYQIVFAATKKKGEKDAKSAEAAEAKKQ